MSNKTNKLIPELRFPEFMNDGDWEKKTIAAISNSKSSSMALNKLELKQTGYPVYGADSIVGYIDEYQQEEKYISIVKDGSGVGRLNLCESHSSILGTLACLKSKNERQYNLVWFYYLLNTVDFSVYVKGAGIPHIYYSDFKSEDIAVPNPQEQQKIASCLSSLDEVIAANKQKLDTLKAHKKGLMQNLFPQEGETVPNYRFPEFENDGEWVEEGIQSLIHKKFIVGHLDGNHGALYPKAEEFSKDGIPYITANDFISGIINFSKCKFLPVNRAKQFKKGVAKNGDILFAHNATVGPVAKLLTSFPYVILSTTATYFRCDNENLINDFLLYALSSPSFVKQYTRVMSQSTRNQVPITTQRQFNLQIPKPFEQQKIASCLSSLDALITEKTKQFEQLKLHKKGLMHGLFPKKQDLK
jgi:type I restriction enzyme S subunit